MEGHSQFLLCGAPKWERGGEGGSGIVSGGGIREGGPCCCCGGGGEADVDLVRVRTRISIQPSTASVPFIGPITI